MTKKLSVFDKKMRMYDRKRIKLFNNIKKHSSELRQYRDKIMQTEGVYEGRIYCFYHYSFKVYWLVDTVGEIVKLLQKINPHKDKQLCEFFKEIIGDAYKVGEWKHEHNEQWTRHTRPIVEAFFHAKYMLDMAVSCSEYDKCPERMIEQKWASLLELYNLR